MGHVALVLRMCSLCSSVISQGLSQPQSAFSAAHFFLFLPGSVNASWPYLVCPCKWRLFLQSGERTGIAPFKRVFLVAHVSDNISAPQTINHLNFNDPMTFPVAASSGPMLNFKLHKDKLKHQVVVSFV